MRSGFTWLELLLATSVAAVFLALAQGPLQHFSSLLTDQYTTSAKQRQLDRFLLMLKAELIQAGYALGDDAEPVQVSSDEVVLLADLNRDGDLNDTRERTPTVFDLLIRDFSVALEVGVIKPWLKRWELSLLPSVLVAICRCHHPSTA